MIASKLLSLTLPNLAPHSSLVHLLGPYSYLTVIFTSVFSNCVLTKRTHHHHNHHVSIEPHRKSRHHRRKSSVPSLPLPFNMLTPLPSSRRPVASASNSPKNSSKRANTPSPPSSAQTPSSPPSRPASASPHPSTSPTRTKDPSRPRSPARISSSSPSP